MQVSVKKTGNKLERRLQIKVPAERIEGELDKRLRSLGKRAKLKGFRPGKAPHNVIVQQYGPSVRQEVLDDMLQAGFSEAVIAEKLQPAGKPRIEDTASGTDGSLTFTATVEIYPEIDLKPFRKLKVEKPVVVIDDADVDKVIESLRRQRVTYDTVTRAARDGDQLTVDFTGRLDGEVFDGGTGNAVPVVLGAGRFLDGFERALEGASAGEVREFDLDFPADYANHALAGKRARFTVAVQAVAAPVLPALDDDFFRAFNIEEGGLERLRSAVHANMARELARTVSRMLKQRVLDGLLALHKFDLPASLVHEEVHRLKHEAAHRMGMQDAKHAHDLPDELFAEQGRRRVSLGLLIAEIIRKEAIKLDPARVQRLIAELAESYDEPQRVIDAYRKDRRMLEGVNAMVMEEQVVERVLQEAKVSEKKATFDEIMNPEREA